MKLLFCLTLFYSSLVFSQEEKAEKKMEEPPSIGSVAKFKGSAQVVRKGAKEPLSVDESFNFQSGDELSTGEKSFIQVKMADDTTISLGAKAKFIFKEVVMEGKRRAIYNMAFGKLRAIIRKKAEDGEEISFETPKVSMGVRGTEFLTNVYNVGGSPVSDVALVKGKLFVNSSKLGMAAKSFELAAGQAFNTADLAKNGLQGIKNLSQEALDKLSGDGFMPELMSPQGAMLGAGAILGLAAGAASGILSGGDDEEEQSPVATEDESKEEEKPVEQASESNQTVEPSKIQKVVYIKPKEVPMDIREAMEKRQEMYRNEGECYYFFYKALPGSSKKERFRRIKDCEEYDYELD